MAEKNFMSLDPLTPGSKRGECTGCVGTNKSLVHGYSLLRTQLNKDYFNDIFEMAAQFGVDIESHRKDSPSYLYSSTY